ncbi:putative zinc finger domain-containing protein [Rosellinia necatrix]|uniref:Putative zinc finger domain-containing protein n=1 Tax=Rosellinia necatrix TaxID=77044 RepID=A0A1W2TQZ4_ROSNE|nr:putative zinc finger domain-containing protein [Rosellinia necatrix]
MEPNSIARTSYLERLPPELIRAILSQLSGLAALRCAILSCRLLLSSFTGSSSAIATRVFLNELDSCDVRPEAMAALLASRLAKPTRSSAHQFYKTHLQTRDVEVGIRLTLSDVADLSRLHSAISRLAEDFTDTRLQELVATMKDGHTSQPQSQPLELSTVERHRIMRTLYILEIFFNVFRQTSMPDAELGQCMNDFLLNFAPWEIEQIACVQDFLFFQVSPSFNEMAAHDVCWGEVRVAPARWLGDAQIQSLYFKGLVSLESIAKAKTYDRQHELFDHGQILDIML